MNINFEQKEKGEINIDPLSCLWASGYSHAVIHMLVINTGIHLRLWSIQVNRNKKGQNPGLLGHGSEIPDRTIELHTKSDLYWKFQLARCYNGWEIGHRRTDRRTDGQTDGRHNDFSRAHFLKMCSNKKNHFGFFDKNHFHNFLEFIYMKYMTLLCDYSVQKLMKWIKTFISMR